MRIEGTAWRMGKEPTLDGDVFTEDAIKTMVETANAHMPMPLTDNFDRSKPYLGEVSATTYENGELRFCADVLHPTLDNDELNKDLKLENCVRPGFVILDRDIDETGIMTIKKAHLVEFSICFEPSPLPEKQNENQ